MLTKEEIEGHKKHIHGFDKPERGIYNRDTEILCDMALQSLEARKLVRELRDAAKHFKDKVGRGKTYDQSADEAIEKADRWLGK